ncbi:MAG: hypothetical protein A3J48_01495 [Candidatus Doudnabacteria bacterium RIFCSPHIGHO2_02_FULL_46_11]|uniref:Uncharacterized protein n=1 Tax=Candidatus Doudnabacteria bacterium RIFCSPHIGHO2_02_FULL_46_11 TaxID=1817832 RepID=A0A1F5P894_9BACT|nr:MAG: hypothetical protein A3J48_01495 [Candidatus Doudnabacteria bacterium RIFCSPHIGHO2_02_FULL_46_11]
MPIDIEQIKQNIDSASYLTDMEKEMLLDIVPHWPQNKLGELLSVFSRPKPVNPIPAQPRAVQAQPISKQVYPSGGASVENLIDRLKSETVNFKDIGRVSQPEVRPQRDRGLTSEKAASNLPNTERKQPAVVAQKRAPVRAVPVEALSSSQDVAALSLAQLRRGNFTENLQIVWSKISEIARQEGLLPYTILKSFYASPVNKLFLSTGWALMNDLSKDREAVFTKVSVQMENDHGESFTSEEFEAFADFREKLDHLM